MKKIIKNFNLIFFFTVLVAFLFSTSVHAQKKIRIAMAEPPSDELGALQQTPWGSSLQESPQLSTRLAAGSCCLSPGLPCQGGTSPPARALTGSTS